jgi:multiple sugar transport system substrate-binding protein
MKTPLNKICFDRYIFAWLGLIIFTIFLILLTQSKSLKEKYPGKKVLRVAFFMRMPEVGRVWDEVKANFEKEHPDVLIIWVEDIQKKLSILEAANMLPDIMTPNTFFLYRYRNSLMPLDDLLEQDQHDMKFDDFYPGLLKLCNYNNKQLTIPYVFNVSLLYYNIDKFNKAGVPLPTAHWTYDDYITAAKQFERYDDEGRQIQWGTSIIPSWWIEWLSHVHKAGGRFISDDWRRSPMEKPEAIRGLTFFNDIVNTHKVSPKARDLDNIPFLNQQTAMDFAGHLDNWIGLRSTATFEWDVTLLPKSPEGENGGERVAVGMGINKKCEHKELAWEFIKYISNYENRVKFVNAGMSPVRKSVACDVFFKRGPDGRYLVDPQHKEVIYQALEHCREQSQLPEFFQLAQTQALPHIYSMLRQEITPEECGQIISKTVTNFLQMIDRKNPLYDYEKGCLKVSDE